MDPTLEEWASKFVLAPPASSIHAQPGISLSAVAAPCSDQNWCSPPDFSIGLPLRQKHEKTVFLWPQLLWWGTFPISFQESFSGLIVSGCSHPEPGGTYAMSCCWTHLYPWWREPEELQKRFCLGTLMPWVDI